MNIQASDWSVRFRPANASQKLAKDYWEHNDILFLLGPAGSGKTHVGMGLALEYLHHCNSDSQKMKQPGRILVTRPSVTCEEDIGFLPGGINDKFFPFLNPFHHVLGRLITFSAKQGQQLSAQKQGQSSSPFKPEMVLENVPLGFLRGRTIKPPEHPVMFIDEAQNCSEHQLKMLLTRLGQNGKVIVTGDPDQSDIGHRSGLKSVAQKLKGIMGIKILEFTEVEQCRHPLVTQIIRKLK